MACCIAEWKCTVCGKPLALKRTSQEGFLLSVFENEDGSPRLLNDDTQARVLHLSQSQNGYTLKNLVCWHCQKTTT